VQFYPRSGDEQTRAPGSYGQNLRFLGESSQPEGARISRVPTLERVRELCRGYGAADEGPEADHQKPQASIQPVELFLRNPPRRSQLWSRPEPDDLLERPHVVCSRLGAGTRLETKHARHSAASRVENLGGSGAEPAYKKVNNPKRKRSMKKSLKATQEPD
jgi:hypothetical protein